MKSVHLSSFLVFVLILAVALGGVSWFSYGSARQALRAKEDSTNALFAMGYREKCSQVNAEFDRELLKRARELVGNLDRRAVWVRNQIEPLYVLGLVNSNLQHHGHLQVWLWLAQSLQPSMIFRLRTPEFHLEPPAKAEALPLEEGEYYWQINSLRLRPLARSENLTFWLPVNEDRKANWQAALDTVTGTDGKALRRVTMPWFNIGRTRDGLIIPLRAPGFPGKGPGTGGGRPPVLFQYACETTDHDETLEKLKQTHDRDVAVLQQEVGRDLASLRLKLAGICGGTFLALSCGGFLVLRAGSVSASGESR